MTYRRWLVPFFCLSLCLTNLAWSADRDVIRNLALTNRVFSPPADAGVINIRDFGAVGDGVSDDTAAFRAAITESEKNAFFRAFVFVPRGTYLVSDTISVGSKRFFTIIGEEREHSIIRLKDACPGFADPTQSKPVFEVGGGPNNNQAFGNYVHNLTISSGKGNPGAAGLRFKASNYGATTEVTIRSEDGAGTAGLLLNWGDPGPEIHRNMHIVGFSYGILSTHAMFGPVFENIFLEGQSQAGIFNTNNCLWIRNVLSRNTVPVLHNAKDTGKDGRPDASMILLDGCFAEGGSADNPAIRCDAGMALIRDVTVSGYGSAITPPSGDSISGPTVSQWISHPMVTMPGVAEVAALRLPVKEHPTPAYENSDTWVNVRSFADVDVDAESDISNWSPAIQRAIDSGATTIYFPKAKGDYLVADTIHIRGKVRHILGFNSLIKLDVDALGNKPVFRFDGAQEEVIIEHLHTTIGDREKRSLGTVAWEHAAAGRFVLQHSLSHAYRSLPGAGELFAMDFCSGTWFLQQPGQKAYFRSINIEGTGGASDATAQFMLNGTHAWILGFKTEHGQTCINAENGAQVELLGGFHYPAQGFGKKGQVPLFRIADSRAALTFSEIAHGPKRGENRHKTPVLEITSGTERALTLSDLPKDLLEMKYGRVVNVPLVLVGQ